MATDKNTALFKKELPFPGKGKAPEIIWLHGWGQDHRSLLRLASLYKNQARNTLYDLPGFGKSAMLEPGAGTADYADAIIRDLRKAGPGHRIVAGHSFGCRVALRIADQAPELVAGLVLISAAGLRRKRGLFWTLKSLGLKLLGKIAHLSDRVFNTALKAKYSERFGSHDYQAAGPLRPTLVATVTEDLSEISTRLGTNVLLLYGDEDTETPPELGIRYHKLLANSCFRILKGFGHLNILTTGAHQCQHSINQFIRDLGGK